MDKHYHISLLRKYLKGKASEEEQQFLFRYYDLLKSEDDLVSDLSPEEIRELKTGMRTAIDMQIASREQPRGRVRQLNTWLKASAAAILLIIGAVYVYNINARPNSEIPVALSEKENKENRLIHLPDGSMVIVSAGSKFNYPSSFDGMDERKVYLEGQAYFDIKHNPSKPFIVYTGNLRTTVLGTAFNVKALPKDEEIIVTVTRGKVRVSNHAEVLGLIEPNQQMIFNKSNENTVHKVVETVDYVKWKEEDMLFDDVTVEEATELLEERFKVKIMFSDSLIKSNRFTTTFPRNADLEKMLKSICAFNNANYQYDRDNAAVLITSNNE